MNVKENINDCRIKAPGKGLPGWWLMAARELTDLWIGGRAFILLILFSILLGVMSFLLATNSELSLIPPREMVFLMLQITIAVGPVYRPDYQCGQHQAASGNEQRWKGFC